MRAHTHTHTHTHTRTHTHTQRINTKKIGCEFLSREFIVILFTSPTHFLNSDEACSGTGYACWASVPAPLCPIPSPTVSLSHSVLFPAPLCPIHTQSHCVPPPAPTVSHHVPSPATLCPISIVSPPHSHSVPFPMCPIPSLHCVPVPGLGLQLHNPGSLNETGTQYVPGLLCPSPSLRVTQ